MAINILMMSLLITSLLVTTFNISIMTKSNKRKSYYKKMVIKVLRNIIFFFHFIFPLKKFILQRLIFSSFAFLFLFTSFYTKDYPNNLLDFKINLIRYPLSITIASIILKSYK